MPVIGYAQFNPEFANKNNNFEKIEGLVASAAGADLLVLPELAATGYDLIDREQAAALAEPCGTGPTALLMMDLARRYRMTLVIGYAEVDGARLYNSSLLVTPAGKIQNYRKLHLFSREKELFSPGDAPPPVVDTPAGRVGLMICYDWFFPETARMLALQGAQILAQPANLVLSFCQRAMFARSVENRLFSITANRIGEESTAGRTLRYTGASQVLDIEGNLLVAAPADAEHIGLAEIDPARADNKSVTSVNDLFRDRRIDIYRQIPE